MQPTIRLPERIATFKSPYHFLSNSWPLQSGLIWESEIFPTVEHAYRWTSMATPEGRIAVMGRENPVFAKLAAADHPVREDWIFIKDEVMLELLRLKFQDRYLCDWLLATGRSELVEDTRIEEEGLGKLLTQIRNELRIAKNMTT